MSHPRYPPWMILHIPHDSIVIPDQIRPQFLLSEKELELELQHMTDHFTHALFAKQPDDATVIRAPVSRLVVDVERFADDALEPMAKRGMGTIYEVTSHLFPLRKSLSIKERENLIRTWYRPHHEKLEAAVADALSRYGQCLIIDGHSFPGKALPYENSDNGLKRPDICIGSDPFHTPVNLERAFIDAFRRQAWSVSLNDPFSGALVPASRYHNDPRVMSVMVEINRDLYLKQSSSIPLDDFFVISNEIKKCCAAAIASFLDGLKEDGRP